jgi:hypothetical protein
VSIGFLAILCIGPAFGQTAFGQTFDVGIMVGVPATEFFETGSTASTHSSASYATGTRRYTLGLTAEWHMTHSWGLELDALYHRFGYGGIVNLMGVDTFTSASFRVSGNAWDFPVLAKYRFGDKRVRPFVAAGGTLRYIATAHEQGQQTFFVVGPLNTTTPISTDSPTDLRKRVYPGVTVAGGLEFGAGRFKIIPQIRYTRWTANIANEGGLLRFAPNQAEFLLSAEF